MKNAILSILLLLSISNANAQLDVVHESNTKLIGQHVYMKVSQIELNKNLKNETFTFTYKDAEYLKLILWKDFTIKNQTSLDELYALCTKMISEKSQNSVDILLPNESKLIVSYSKTWKGITFTIINSVGIKSSTAPPMKQKKLDSLFGKS